MEVGFVMLKILPKVLYVSEAIGRFNTHGLACGPVGREGKGRES